MVYGDLVAMGSQAPRRAVGALLGLACVAVAGPADAQSASRAHGAPNRGRLTDGVLLEATDDMLVLPGAHRWGTEELVGMLGRAATRLREEEPGPRVLVGELSRQTGGYLPPHGSHQNGRDADVGYLMVDAQNEPVEVTGFLELQDDMCARASGQVYCLDRMRTFLLFAAMVQDPIARVQWILVAADLRQRILAAGRRSGVEPEVYDQVELLTRPRQGSEVHRNHFHIRILCPEDDRPGCQHQGPTPVRQPWRDTPTGRRGRRRVEAPVTPGPRVAVAPPRRRGLTLEGDHGPEGQRKPARSSTRRSASTRRCTSSTVSAASSGQRCRRCASHRPSVSTSRWARRNAR